ncbi:MAG TPA: DUF4376 domain-containing protein [Nitrobacter sp.]|nr:DUF4376 domain-containing protein [Nitrobacter sp.]
MLIVQENPADIFIEIMQGSSFRDASNTLHGWDVTQLWSDEELAGIGVYRVQPSAITAGRTPTGYTFSRDGDGNIVQVISYGDLKADLKAYAADKRWQKEVGGITVNGVPIATDDRSKQMIMGARMAAEADSNFTTPWVANDGNVHTLTAAEVIAISNAVLAHVAACFATFATVAAKIDSEEIAGAAQVDAAFG